MSEEQKTDFISRVLSFADRQGFDKDKDIGEAPLRYLEYYLTRHFTPGSKLRTMEFGCGVSTLVFSEYAREHVVCDARNGFKERKQKLKNDIFSNKAIISYYNQGFESQKKTIDADMQFDVALFNGIKSYPLPEVDFYSVLPHLKTGSIVVLNEIEIPTIGKLLEFLKQDDMFYLHSVVQNTAFLTRTSASIFNYKEQSWREQPYNAQNYVGPSWNAYGVGLPMPMDTTFDGRLKVLGSWFERGFSLSGGRPITDGWYSSIRLPFEKPIDETIVITLDLEAIVPDKRAGAGLFVDINGLRVADVLFEGTTRQQVVVTAKISGEHEIAIGLTHQDVQPAGQLRPLSGAGMPDSRRPNVVVHALSVRLQDSAETKVDMRRADGSIVSFDCKGQSFRFFVENANDSIQAHHNVGEFYEIEELELLTGFIPRGARILDIGANIGNHSVWFEKILGARLIMPVEPQARMVALYRTNCRLNGLVNIDERCLGLALGDVNQSGEVQIDQAFNPAGARIEPSETGEIQIRIGDEVLANDIFDFVKIDVEGAEIAVIKGLKALFARCRPLLFVEVWEENRSEFDQLMAEFDYEIVSEYRRYDIATNLLLKSRHAGGLTTSVSEKFKKWINF